MAVRLAVFLLEVMQPKLMPISIAPVDYDSPRHRQAVVDLLASYAADPIAGAGTTLSDYARVNLVDGLRDHPKSHVLLAQAEGQFAGLAVSFEGYSTFAARPLLNLHDLVVAPASRGQGVGSRLLEAVEEEARRRGCCFLTLEVNGPNTDAQRLYRKQGFVGGDAISPPDAMMFWKKRLGG